MFEPGTVIADKYRIESLLGDGGMGSVYLTTNLRLGVPVAVKVLHCEGELTPEALERFRREARAAGSVNHPNVVRASDYDVWNGTPWIAMEALRGESLRKRLDHMERLPVPDALSIMLPVVRACVAIHSVGVVHRDLKPENVFLQDVDGGGEVVRVLDFGIAKMAVAAHASLTADGIVLGTLHYLAPEQATNARDADARADVWALGVMLYELVTGSVPFPANGLMHLHVLHRQRTPVDLRTAVPSVPQSLSHVVRDCLRLARDERISSCAELLTRLEAVQVVEAAGARTVRGFAALPPEGPNQSSCEARPAFETQLSIATPGAMDKPIPPTRDGAKRAGAPPAIEAARVPLPPTAKSSGRARLSLQLVHWALISFVATLVAGLVWLFAR